VPIAKRDGYGDCSSSILIMDETEKRELEAFRLLKKEFNAVKSYEIDLPFFKR